MKKRRFAKRAIALLLTVFMLLAMTACGSTSSGNSASSNETGKSTSSGKVKVGFIFVGSKDDYGYNQAAYLGSEEVEKELGDKVEVIRAENVPETEEASRVLEQMINNGATILFPTSYGHLQPAMDVAKNHPECVFYHQGGLQTADNLGTYFGTIWQCFYLSGMTAGSCTKTNKLGFVASFPIPQVLANINAFELGARSVNPDATTNVIFTGSWSDPALQTSSAQTLLDGGVDVITQHQDSTKTIVEFCEKNNIYTCGNHVDASELAPNAWLTGAEWNWGKLYVDMTKVAMNGKFKGSIYDGKYRGGLKEGVIDLAPFGKSVPKDVQDKVNKAKEDMINGSLFAFTGEIKAQDGTVECKKGEKLTIDQIESMDYLVDGVIGSIK
jgi:basic membrane protein A